MCSQAIVTGNELTMSLSGFATGGQLGTNQQMRDELDFATNTTIKPARRRVLQSIINPFIKENQRVGACPKWYNVRCCKYESYIFNLSLDANALLLQVKNGKFWGLMLWTRKRLNLNKQRITQPIPNGNSDNANQTE